MDKISDILSVIQLFNGLSRGQLAEIGSIAAEKNFSRGEVIFTEGDDGTGFYVVVEGSVKVYKLSPDGKEKILHIFSKGQPFGEVPVFAGKQFPVNAEAITDARTLFFPRAAFLELIGKNPILALQMLADLSNKLRQFAGQIENLSLKETPARLATYLLLLAREQGREDEVTLRISKGHLASLLGTIPETLSRVFAKLSGQDLIVVNGRRIRLRDPEGLRELSESGRGAV